MQNLFGRGYNKLNKENSSAMVSGILLTKNQIEDSIKVTKFFENREILLNGTFEKIKSQEGGFLANFLNPLIKVGLPLIENILIRLVYSAASASDAGIHPEIQGLGTASTVSNQEMEDIVKIVKSLEESGLFLKGSDEKI